MESKHEMSIDDACHERWRGHRHTEMRRQDGTALAFCRFL